MYQADPRLWVLLIALVWSKVNKAKTRNNYRTYKQERAKLSPKKLTYKLLPHFGNISVAVKVTRLVEGSTKPEGSEGWPRDNSLILLFRLVQYRGIYEALTLMSTNSKTLHCLFSPASSHLFIGLPLSYTHTQTHLIWLAVYSAYKKSMFNVCEAPP